MIIKEMMILNGRDVRIGASLLVGDIHDMVRFYRDTLGFHTEWDGGDFAEFGTHETLLAGGRPQSPGKGRFTASPNAPQDARPPH